MSSENEKVFWVHSCYTKNEYYEDAVVVKERVVKEDGTSEGRLKIYKNPKCRFWVTKEGLRTHKYKKEYENKNNLDEYETDYLFLVDELWKNTGNFGKPRQSLRQICNNPYIYGADIDIEVLVKNHYIKNYEPGTMCKYTRGMLDIESSVLGCDRINAITFIHEKKIYCTMLDAFMFKTDNSNNRVKATLDDIELSVAKYVKPYMDEHNFEIELFLANDEISMIEWIWSKIHFHKTDFIGIWNMDYDIPQILSRIEANGRSPEKILCDPSIPQGLRKCNYYKGKIKDGEHFTDRWSWFNCTSASQPIDSMCLYSRIRKSDGRKTSYSLDAVSTEELGVGKLVTETQSTHHFMQKNRFVDYVAYNIVDTLLLQLMEFKNADIQTLTGLVSNSKLSDFNKQTVMLKNKFYQYCTELNLVPASSGTEMMTEFDKMMVPFGGTVLAPERAKGVGLHAVHEIDEETLFHIFVSDVDAKSMYPSVTAGLNISKETQLSSTINIEGKNKMAIESLYGGLANPMENSVPIMNRFFNLPPYTEVGRLYSEYIINKRRDN